LIIRQTWRVANAVSTMAVFGFPNKSS